MGNEIPQAYRSLVIRIENKEWSSENLSVISRIRKWKAVDLSLYGNNQSKMIKNIQHIHFPELLHLNLGENKITSVEAITNISMPYLQNLYLPYNKVISVKTIRKAQWPDLIELYLVQNQVHDGCSLTEAHFSKLQLLSIDWMKMPEPSHFLDHRFLCKVSTDCFQFFSNGILQLRIEEKTSSQIFRHLQKEMEKIKAAFLILFFCFFVFFFIINSKNKNDSLDTASRQEKSKFRQFWHHKGFGKLKKEENLHRIKLIKQWLVEELLLCNVCTYKVCNYHEDIIKQITHIKFTELRALNLGNNYITSIESLSDLFLPLIQILVVHSNSIRSISVIKKMRWPQLKHLNLKENKIREGNSLFAANFPQLQTLTPDTITVSSRYFLFNEMVKLQTFHLKKFGIQLFLEENNHNFINKNHIKNILSFRWPDLKITM